MSDLAIEAERQKLTRLLGCPPEVVDRLEGLDLAGLRQLRAACTSMLFDGDRDSLQRVVKSSRLLPLPIKALVAEKALGPVLGSRVAGLLPPQEAADIAKRVSLEFNVQVTLLIDPRRAVALLQLIPVSLVVEVTRELVKLREYIAMARFVDALTDEQIRACIDVLDDEALLRIGFYVESPQRLEEVVGLIGKQRLQRVVAVSAQPELGLDGAVMSMINGVGDVLAARLIEAALLHEDPSVAKALVTAARRHDALNRLRGLRSKLATDAKKPFDQIMEQD